MSGLTSFITSSNFCIALVVISVNVWPCFIIFRSYCGFISNVSNTWSNIWRCCAVTQTILSIFSLLSNSLTSGAILIASGLVPNTVITLTIKFSHFLYFCYNFLLIKLQAFPFFILIALYLYFVFTLNFYLYVYEVFLPTYFGFSTS